MKREELEKEAEEWVISNTEIYDDKFGIECETEPRAKEAYLAGAEPREKRIEQLEVDNAFYKRACEGATMMYKHLTKAKEIIKKLIEAIHIWDCKNLEQVEAEAEQFISEVEK